MIISLIPYLFTPSPVSLIELVAGLLSNDRQVLHKGKINVGISGLPSWVIIMLNLMYPLYILIILSNEALSFFVNPVVLLFSLLDKSIFLEVK
jgi:hypothetical protein